MEKNFIKNNNHIIWIDSLKGLAIFAVVLGHALLGFQQQGAFPESQSVITLIKDWIYTWHMPLFFVLSGAAFRISCLKNNTVNFKKVKRNALNIFIIYLLFNIMLTVLKVIFSRFVNNKVTLLDFGKVILLPNTLMWYLYVLIIYYFFFAFLFNKKLNKLVLFAILLCLSVTANYFYKAEIFTELCIKNLFFCSVFFYIGMYFKELEYVVLNKGVLFISGLLLCLNAGYMIYTYLIIEYRNALVDSIILEVNAFAVIILLCFVFQKISILEKNLLFIILGNNSLVIYLLHTYLVTSMRAAVLKIGISSAFIAVVLCTVIPLLITVLVAFIIPKISILKYIFKPILLIDKIKSGKR
jgi:hypothetical protein rflaF_06982